MAEGENTANQCPLEQTFNTLVAKVSGLQPVMRYLDVTNLPYMDDTRTLPLQDVATRVQLLLLQFLVCDSSPAGRPVVLGRLSAHSIT